MADYPDRPGYSFDPGPPPEASRYLRNKELRPAFSWADVEPEEHAVAFTVAKTTQVDVLQTIRDEVQRALDEGRTFQDFKRDLKPELVKRGWWGGAEMIDPKTGETQVVQLGSPRRLKVIYDANLRSARAAGQWERIERTKNALPYLEYRLGPSERHRPHHASKEHLVLPVDDPFWNAWMPPNGWGCKCWVKQLTARQATRQGISDSPEVDTRSWTNHRTGEVRQVPAGIDPGWERNPGKMRAQAMEKLLEEKLQAADPMVAEVATRDIATSWRAERVLKGEAPGAVPIAVLPEEVASAAGIETRIVKTTAEYGRKFIDKQRGVTTETLGLLNSALRDGRLLIDVKGDAPRLYVMAEGDAPWLFVLKLMRAEREIWVNSAYPLKASRLKKLLANPLLTTLRE